MRRSSAPSSTSAATCRRERRTLFPTQLGIEVTDLLKPFFPDIMDVEFTAQMEDSLDKIEDGERAWGDTVKEFYARFEPELRRAEKEMRNVKAATETGEACPECGQPLLERWGRFGKFLACSAYPDCRYTRDLSGNERAADEPTDEMCPTCGKPMVIKHGRYGKFIACSGYPECKTTKPVTLGIACPQPGCAGQLVARRSKRGRVFYGCSAYPELHVRGLAAPRGRSLPEVRRGVLDRAGGARARRAAVRARGMRLRARGRDRGRMTEPLQRFLRYLSVEGRPRRTPSARYRIDLDDFRRFCDRGALRRRSASVDGRADPRLPRPSARRGLDPVTVARHLSALRSWFRFLVRQGVVERNPARESGARACPASSSRFCPWTRRSRWWTRAASPAAPATRDVAILELLYASGLRVSELTGLDVEDVDARR